MKTKENQKKLAHRTQILFQFGAWILPLIIVASLLSGSAMTSCSSSSEVGRPPLSEELMQKLAPELALVEGILAVEYTNSKDKADKSRELYNKVLSQHGVSMDDYKRTLEFYIRNPNKMLQLTRETLDSLNNYRF